MKRIKSKYATLLLIPVTDDAYRPTLITNPNLKHRYEMFEWTERRKGTEHAVHIHNAQQWEPLDFLKNITEEQWEKIVEKSELFKGTGKFICYTPSWRFAKYKGQSCTTAKRSGQSLIESHGVTLKQNYFVLKLIKS